MNIKFSDLKKMELSGASHLPRVVEGKLALIVQLNEGCELPEYVHARCKISSLIYTANVLASDIDRLDKDPAVLSYSVARPMSSVSTSG
jgi:hypothetical protein